MEEAVRQHTPSTLTQSGVRLSFHLGLTRDLLPGLDQNMSKLGVFYPFICLVLGRIGVSSAPKDSELMSTTTSKTTSVSKL